MHVSLVTQMAFGRAASSAEEPQPAVAIYRVWQGGQHQRSDGNSDRAWNSTGTLRWFNVAIIACAMFLMSSRLALAGTAVVVSPVPCWWMYSFGDAIYYLMELIKIGAALWFVAPALRPFDFRHMPTSRKTGLRRFLPWRRNPDRSSEPARPAVGETGYLMEHPDGLASREVVTFAILRVIAGLQLLILPGYGKLPEACGPLTLIDRFSFLDAHTLLEALNTPGLHAIMTGGPVDLVFGALLLANIATRAASAVLAGIFGLTGVLFGLEDLAGHLPLVATLLVLIMIAPASRAISRA